MRFSLVVLVCAGLGCAKKPSAADVGPATKVVEALEGVDAAGAPKLLFMGCSEIPSCAAGCSEDLAMCARDDTNPSQCAALLAHCSGFDYRARRDKGEMLAPDAWVKDHFSGFLDALEKAAPDPKLKAARARAKL